jgi:formiminotetrahydrofolate cyclodeaminase
MLPAAHRDGDGEATMAQSDLRDLPVHALLELMASARPDPAAGSAAALSVALAAALLGKTARLSGRHLDDAERLAGQADDLRVRAVRLGQADAEAVTSMVAAARGPGTDAMAVPREIGEVAAEVDRLAAHLGEHGNPRLRADAQAAHHLAEAAARASRAILRSNEKLLP